MLFMKSQNKQSECKLFSDKCQMKNINISDTDKEPQSTNEYEHVDRILISVMCTWLADNID